MKFRAPRSGFTKVPNTVSSQNVDLRLNATTAMHIRALRGQVVTLKVPCRRSTTRHRSRSVLPRRPYSMVQDFAIQDGVLLLDA